jgi:hypothetical protein
VELTADVRDSLLIKELPTDAVVLTPPKPASTPAFERRR